MSQTILYCHSRNNALHSRYTRAISLLLRLLSETYFPSPLLLTWGCLADPGTLCLNIICRIYNLLISVITLISPVTYFLYPPSYSRTAASLLHLSPLPRLFLRLLRHNKFCRFCSVLPVSGYQPGPHVSRIFLPDCSESFLLPATLSSIKMLNPPPPSVNSFWQKSDHPVDIFQMVF